MKSTNLKLRDFKVAILVCEGFEEIELVKPRKALEEAHATVHVISPVKNKVKCWDRTSWGKSYKVDVDLAKANPNDYDALMLPGGVLNPDKLRTFKKAIQFIDHFFKKHKPITAICHGAVTIIETGRLENRTITSYAAIKTDLINAGANWVNRKVVIDHNLLTSRQPDDLPAFNKAMIKMFINANNIKHHNISSKLLDIMQKPFIK
ncbi:MAG TPA: type 1 glutamine amidotransferase domain-containing protein [Gammaproteobacteria bacterium]|nr:type 1 glutamine amidotransferase domain-containing protein [Gammaproteobacteria bacterium]